MKRVGFALLVGVALLAPFASASIAAEPTVAAQPNDGRTIQAFKHGKNFVVVVHRRDGSAAVAVVEAQKVHLDHAGHPNLTELSKKGRVIYSVTLAPEGTPLAQSIDLSRERVPIAGMSARSTDRSPGAPVKPGANLSRRQKSKLVERIKLTARMLRVAGQGIAEGSRTPPH